MDRPRLHSMQRGKNCRVDTGIEDRIIVSLIDSSGQNTGTWRANRFSV